MHLGPLLTQAGEGPLNRDTLDVACDHYNRFREDFALMRSLGIRSYRLSIAWPRIFPKGDQGPSTRRPGFLPRLFDAMAENGITPWVTLFHWDLPQALEDRGGWLNRVTVDAFATYADTVVKAYCGKVKHWITVNEIRCFTSLAYGPGGFKALGSSSRRRRSTSPSTMRSYATATASGRFALTAARALRSGITDNCDVCAPVTETPLTSRPPNAWFKERNLHILDPIYAAEAYSKEYLLTRWAGRARRVEGRLQAYLGPDRLPGRQYLHGLLRARQQGQEVRAAGGMPAHYPRADSR